MSEEYEEYEEHEGVSIEIDPEGWPENLDGVMVNGKPFYIIDGVVTITGEPIWKFGITDEL